VDVAARLEAVETENEILREKVAQLEELLGLTFPAPLEFGLTGSEAKAFGVLMNRDIATKDAIMAGLYADKPFGGEAEPKIVDVFICKARRKLKPFSIKIETVWGQGYRLTPETKAIVRSMLEADFAAQIERSAQ
jgi:two-component system cell cycle response regulator CtrA